MDGSFRRKSFRRLQNRLETGVGIRNVLEGMFAVPAFTGRPEASNERVRKLSGYGLLGP